MIRKFLLCHEPDELIEADGPVPVLIDLADELLQLQLRRGPAECPHHLAQLHRGDAAATIPDHLIHHVMYKST